MKGGMLSLTINLSVIGGWSVTQCIGSVLRRRHLAPRRKQVTGDFVGLGKCTAIPSSSELLQGKVG